MGLVHWLNAFCKSEKIMISVEKLRKIIKSNLVAPNSNRKGYDICWEVKKDNQVKFGSAQIQILISTNELFI